MLQTRILGTIMKFIANYIKGRKTYTQYRNHTAILRQLKTGVLQGGVLSPRILNFYTADLPPPGALVQVMSYTDDIIITFTYTSTSATKKYIQPYAIMKSTNIQTDHFTYIILCRCIYFLDLRSAMISVI